MTSPFNCSRGLVNLMLTRRVTVRGPHRHLDRSTTRDFPATAFSLLRRTGIKLAGPLGNAELRLNRARPQIRPNRSAWPRTGGGSCLTARQLCPPRDLPNGQMLPQRPTPNNAQKLHVDHSVFPCCLQPRGRCTLVKSQWKLHAYPGHFRVQINSQGAVFTEEVRCGNRRAVGCHQINVRRIQFGVSCPKSKVQRHPPGRIGRGRPHGANPVALGKQIGNRPEAPQTPVKRLKRQPARPSAV